MLSGRTSARLDVLRVHNPVYPGLMRNHLIRRLFRGGLGVIRAPAVPYASHTISKNDLDEATGLDVSDLDESAVEKEDIGRVPGNPLHCAFPLDRTHTAAWVSVAVNVQPKLYGSYQLVPPPGFAANVPS